jgi:hypothetical protein
LARPPCYLLLLLLLLLFDALGQCMAASCCCCRHQWFWYLLLLPVVDHRALAGAATHVSSFAPTVLITIIVDAVISIHVKLIIMETLQGCHVDLN